jgi:hypothetical protein
MNETYKRIDPAGTAMFKLAPLQFGKRKAPTAAESPPICFPGVALLFVDEHHVRDHFVLEIGIENRVVHDP